MKSSHLEVCTSLILPLFNINFRGFGRVSDNKSVRFLNGRISSVNLIFKIGVIYFDQVTVRSFHGILYALRLLVLGVQKLYSILYNALASDSVIRILSTSERNAYFYLKLVLSII